MTQTESLKTMTIGELSQLITVAKTELEGKLRKIVDEVSETGALHGIHVTNAIASRRGRRAKKA